jgi:hypothetical protein
MVEQVAGNTVHCLFGGFKFTAIYALISPDKVVKFVEQNGVVQQR